MQITLPLLLAALAATTSAAAIPQPRSVDAAPHVESPKSNFKIPVGDITHYSKDGLDGPEVRAIKRDEENPKEHNLSEDRLDSDDRKDSSSDGAKKSSTSDDAKKSTSFGNRKKLSDDKSWIISASFGPGRNKDAKSSDDSKKTPSIFSSDESKKSSDSKRSSEDKSWSIGDVFGKSDSKDDPSSKPSSSSSTPSTSSSSDSKKSSDDKSWTESISDWFKSNSKDSKSSSKNKSISARGNGHGGKNSEALADAKKYVDENVKGFMDWMDKKKDH